MSELRERLQEAADAAIREGRTPTAAVLVTRGRRRRLRLAGGTAALLVLVLVLLAVTVGTDRLSGQPAPLAPQVLFRKGIAPLELEPIQAGDRFPVNFYVGFYRQPNEDKNLEWWVTKVVAYDKAGRKVAECRATAGPGHNC